MRLKRTQPVDRCHRSRVFVARSDLGQPPGIPPCRSDHHLRDRGSPGGAAAVSLDLVSRHRPVRVILAAAGGTSPGTKSVPPVAAYNASDVDRVIKSSSRSARRRPSSRTWCSPAMSRHTTEPIRLVCRLLAPSPVASTCCVRFPDFMVDRNVPTRSLRHAPDGAPHAPHNPPAKVFTPRSSSSRWRGTAWVVEQGL